MATLETVVAMALKHESVMEELGAALRSDLVLGNPHQRRLIEFADTFLAEHGHLPDDGDYNVWLESLAEGNIRDGTREAWGRVLTQNVDGHEPKHFVAHVRPILEKGAAQNALARLNSAAAASLEPETLYQLAAAVQAAGERKWPPAPDLPGPADPHPLLAAVLPPVLRDFVHTVATSTQVSPDMVTVLVLAAVSAAVAGKAYVRPDDAWTREWLSFFGVAVAEPAERKSAVFRAVCAPLHSWEAKNEKALMPKLRIAKHALTLAKKEHSIAIDGLAHNKNNPRTGKPFTAQDVEDARKKLERAESAISAIPRIVVNDITAEAIVKRMVEQGGRIAIMSAEGGPLRLFDGRYSEGAARLEELAHGYDGEPIHVERMGRDPMRVANPSLTLGVALQPSVLDTLRNARSMKGQGIFGRISWVLCPPRAGTRRDSSKVPALDAQAVHRYEAAIEQLLAWQPIERDGEKVPHVLTLSPEAAEVKFFAHDEYESELGPGGRFHGIADWAGKNLGRAMRIAALLQLADRADQAALAGDGSLLNADPISGSFMAAGTLLARDLATHALYLYGRVDMDNQVTDLAWVWDRLRRMPPGTKETDLQRRVKKRFTARELEAVVDELVARGLVRRRPRPATGGRPESPVLEVHPAHRVGGAAPKESPESEAEEAPAAPTTALDYGKLMTTRDRAKAAQAAEREEP